MENLMNQVISGYCSPCKEAIWFMWEIVLDTSVMSLGAKAKVVLAVSHELKYKIDKDAIHNVISLRNAFAHHATNRNQVYVGGRVPGESYIYHRLSILRTSGKVDHVKRDEAFAEFTSAYASAYGSLGKLIDLVREKRQPTDI